MLFNNNNNNRRPAAPRQGSNPPQPGPRPPQPGPRPPQPGPRPPQPGPRPPQPAPRPPQPDPRSFSELTDEQLSAISRPQSLEDLQQLMSQFGGFLTPQNKAMVNELIDTLRQGGDQAQLQSLAARMSQAINQ